MAFTILIADDEPLEREALLEIVSGVGDATMTVRCAANGTEAVGIAEMEPPDLAFLDIRMPGRSGLEVAELIRRDNAGAAIVFISAFDYFEYAQTAIRLQAEDYLVKPVEDDAVRRIIERVRERHHVEENAAGVEPDNAANPDGDARFTEVARFLEREILDDIIAGDIGRTDLSAAFQLLGFPAVRGEALIVQPDLRRYPFRLETPRQRRTVVQRVLRAIENALSIDTIRFLKRAHEDIGYIVALRITGPEEAPILPELVETARQRGEEAGATPLRIVHSAAFEGIPAMSEAIRTARSTLATRPDERSLEDTDPSREDRLIRQLLKAIIDGDGEMARRWSGDLWDSLADPGRGLVTDVSPLAPEELRERANRTLAFLHRTVRNRGITLPGEEMFLLAPTVSDRKVMRIEYMRRTVSLLEREGRSPDDNLARRVTDFLRDRYRDDIGLTDIADYLSLSVSHCSRVISRRFGKPFRQVLREYRLHAARRILSEGTLPIREVAEGVGFRDPNYFSRVFQTHYGMSPSEYRNTIVP